MIDAADRALCDAALAARERAFAPFSSYRVGAAVRARGGRVHGGCNVESASYGLTCCAERVAVFKAVSEGDVDLVAVAIATGDQPPARPCGACRQVLHEFGPGMRVVLCNDRGDAEVVGLDALLPQAFSRRPSS